MTSRTWLHSIYCTQSHTSHSHALEGRKNTENYKVSLYLLKEKYYTLIENSNHFILNFVGYKMRKKAFTQKNLISINPFNPTDSTNMQIRLLTQGLDMSIVKCQNMNTYY